MLSLTRELGPVLAGLMVAGRVGAAMAAEIGTMRVTEQIDALTTLSTNPFKYLVVPRLIAGVVTLPLLVLVADIIGVFGGYLVGVYKLDFNAGDLPAQHDRLPAVRGRRLRPGQGRGVRLPDRADGLLPRLSLARAARRASAQATTNAVVSASILILPFNYFITEACSSPLMSEPATPKISLRGVTKAFGPQGCCDGIDLDVAARRNRWW